MSTTKPEIKTQNERSAEPSKTDVAAVKLVLKLLTKTEGDRKLWTEDQRAAFDALTNAAKSEAAHIKDIDADKFKILQDAEIKAKLLSAPLLESKKKRATGEIEPETLADHARDDLRLAEFTKTIEAFREFRRNFHNSNYKEMTKLVYGENKVPGSLGQLVNYFNTVEYGARRPKRIIVHYDEGWRVNLAAVFDFGRGYLISQWEMDRSGIMQEPSGVTVIYKQVLPGHPLFGLSQKQAAKLVDFDLWKSSIPHLTGNDQDEFISISLIQQSGTGFWFHQFDECAAFMVAEYNRVAALTKDEVALLLASDKSALGSDDEM